MAANGFLFAAFAAVASLQIARGYRFVFAKPLLLAGIPCLGFLLSLLVLFGLIGAAKALAEAKEEYEHLVPSEDERSKLPKLHSEGAALALGRASSWGVTILFATAWLLLLGFALSSLFFSWPHR